MFSEGSTSIVKRANQIDLITDIVKGFFLVECAVSADGRFSFFKLLFKENMHVLRIKYKIKKQTNKQIPTTNRVTGRKDSCTRIVCVRRMEHMIKLFGSTNFRTAVALLKVKCGGEEMMTFPGSHRVQAEIFQLHVICFLP